MTESAVSNPYVSGVKVGSRLKEKSSTETFTIKSKNGILVSVTDFGAIAGLLAQYIPTSTSDPHRFEVGLECAQLKVKINFDDLLFLCGITSTLGSVNYKLKYIKDNHKL